MDITAKNGKTPGGTGAGRKHECGKSMTAYIEIKESPREQRRSGSIKEEAGWLFVRK
ncbi:MAG: hypothetical protein HFI88_03470 [Lachnospiraceae bacterium]|nr:hypothetical protein [Lachnospiraceae bacterium]